MAGDPDNIEFQFYLGTAYEQGGQPAEAVKIFSRLLEQSKGDSEELKANRGVFQQHLAASYQDMGEYQKAIAIYEEMVKSDPTPRTYFMLINAYRVDRQFDKALSLGKQQLEKNPRDENLALVYARSLADAGKTKDGAEILNKLMQSNPDQPGPLRQPEPDLPGGQAVQRCGKGHVAGPGTEARQGAGEAAAGHGL